MRILIEFNADNAAFVDNFEDEIQKIMKQATEYLVDKRNVETLHDSNGNKIGTVFKSTVIRPRRSYTGD